MNILYHKGFLYSDLGLAPIYKSTSASKPVFKNSGYHIYKNWYIMAAENLYRIKNASQEP